MVVWLIFCRRFWHMKTSAISSQCFNEFKLFQKSCKLKSGQCRILSTFKHTENRQWSQCMATKLLEVYLAILYVVNFRNFLHVLEWGLLDRFKCQNREKSVYQVRYYTFVFVSSASRSDWYGMESWIKKKVGNIWPFNNWTKMILHAYENCKEFHRIKFRVWRKYEGWRAWMGRGILVWVESLHMSL